MPPRRGALRLTKQERLANNIPRTIDNTRVYDSSSYLTADPASRRAAAEKAAEASKALNASEDDEEDEDEDMEESDGEEGDVEEDEGPQAGPSRLSAADARPTGVNQSKPSAGPTDEPAVDPSAIFPQSSTLPPGPPPRIMITTSPSPCKDTYAFCDDLRGIFPGGEFFKRPKGKGFEIGRVARWAAKRGFNAVCVVNEDHKIASKLPPGVPDRWADGQMR
jgi:ribosome production factor 1